jgi:hypothetical protein
VESLDIAAERTAQTYDTLVRDALLGREAGFLTGG